METGCTPMRLPPVAAATRTAESGRGSGLGTQAGGTYT